MSHPASGSGSISGPLSGSLTTTEAASMGIKLRESCDSCLQAKVKCGKGRPICARCLGNGAECQYSPSARAGRKNKNGVKKSVADTTPHKRHSSNDMPKTPLASPTSQYPLPPPSSVQSHHIACDSKKCDTSLNIPPALCTAANQAYGTTTPPLTSEDKALSLETQPYGDTILPDTDDFSLNFLPTPPFNQYEFSDEFCQLDGSSSASTSASFPDFSLCPPVNRIGHPENANNWINQDPTYTSTQSLGNGSMESSFFNMSSPIQSSPNPHTQSSFHGQAPNQQLQATVRHCDCFDDCIQSFRELHTKSSPKDARDQSGPQLDEVLQMNSATMNACNKMLGCPPCSTKGGIGISSMLMATMFGKVISLYRAAVHHRFELSNPSQDLSYEKHMAFGAYLVDGEDRQLLEIAILLHELRKVEKTMVLWRKASEQLTADKDVTSVYEALFLFLGRELHNISDFLRQRSKELSEGLERNGHGSYTAC